MHKDATYLVGREQGLDAFDRMFSILSRLTFLAYGDANDTVGLNPNKVFGGARKFCEEELGKDSPSLDKCESQLLKDATGICGGVIDRYGTCYAPKGGVQDGSVPS
ncbi:hypothetical protein GUITHDRAFT_110762 [Guillardia theta CCMP2712]|uniref:Uncharacterized protein n=1 Tax=Guillardia theta (strain CCMP2712) TaxID=905079 RepID=L1J5J3_GUITC|nr:hypothetical protein GUITHDRAFT_110762 [Guillardia theta CCMP2712]EKX43345.1 hypothetical protein GUITHDRAFT_110762 [Guillardia theta CCMP2712]|eukprot:XP_005830325.1 hypothetical protein GUITHDRAFT_110762 [Guillardia theta CCMP2712]